MYVRANGVAAREPCAHFNTGVAIFKIETDEGFMATGYASNATDAAV